MKQKCYMAMLYANWVLYLGGVVVGLALGSLAFVVVWALGVPLFMWVYVRAFPRISRLVGYGTVHDEAAPAASELAGAAGSEPAGAAGSPNEPRPAEVTLYTALGCPFCPIVENRLVELAKQAGFTLRKVDVTLRPGVLKEKGILAVPVVEVGEERLIGNATSRQLADLLDAGRPLGAS